ncbi:DUF2628 domain-containing protein [Psychrobacter sp. AOP22-C1-C5]|uniref:DUF2628 domain-containing protein n=1 Tax=Psychrobacter sp. AOP22-C1-C5 TaxID=3457716 RepID=UPI0040362F27
MQCTNCGQENSRDALICSNCDQRLANTQAQTPPPLTPINISKEAQNVQHGSPADSDTADTLLATFVGEKYDSYYREKWFENSQPRLTLDKKDTPRPKFNLAGVLLGISWLSYRKMYKIAFFVMLGISLLDTVLMYVLGEQTYNVLSNSLFLGVGIVITGLFGNYFYLNHSIQRIKKITSSNCDSNIVRERLAKAGGTSWLGAIGFTILLVTMSVLISYFLGPDWYWVE